MDEFGDNLLITIAKAKKLTEGEVYAFQVIILQFSVIIKMEEINYKKT
ncbi:MAG: hypothetical protein ACLRPW_01610 [Intestinibacter sp.]